MFKLGIEEFFTTSESLNRRCTTISGKYAPEGKGYFVAPTLFLARDTENALFHEKEIFGPCSTILPYDGQATSAVRLVARGEGCLVSALYTSDREWLEQALVESASWNGRLVVISKKVADGGLPPGMVHQIRFMAVLVVLEVEKNWAAYEEWICIQIELPFREIEDFYRRFWAKRSKQQTDSYFPNHLNLKNTDNNEDNMKGPTSISYTKLGY